MTTAREWLVEQDLAKPGRGKFSNAAKAALEAAVKDGMVFEDYSTTPQVKSPQKPTSRRTRASKPVGQQTIEPAEPIYSGGAKFVAWVDGKKQKVNPKEACSHSGVSLSYCSCVVTGLYAQHFAIVGKHGSQDVSVEGL